MDIKNNKLNVRLSFLFVCLLLIGGCSASFTYNNIGWLSSFWVDDYVDLNKQQSEDLEQLIIQTRDWHRKTQLPVYKKDLIEFKALLASSTAKETVVLHLEKAKFNWQILLEKVSEPLITIAHTLSVKQRQQFVNAIKEKIDDEREEHDEKTPQELTEERLEEQLDIYEDWIGGLSKEQVKLITAANTQFIPTFAMWQQYKQTRLNALVAVFENTALPIDEFNHTMEYIITQRTQFMSHDLITANQQNLALNAALLVDLKASLTAKQVAHVEDEFEDLIEQLDDLIND